MKRAIKDRLGRYGLVIGRMHPSGRVLDPSLQPDVERGIGLVSSHTMLSRERLAILFELVHHLVRQGIPGALVECGVWKGGAVAMMGYAAKRFGDPRDLHLFDVFADIGEPDHRVDGERAIREAGGLEHAHGRLQSIRGVYDSRGGHGTIEACREVLERRVGYDAARAHYHPGWFENTLTTGVPELGPIALLRVDADWYAPTRLALETLYDRVSPGGAIVIDDYGAYDGCRKAVDEFVAARGIRAFLNHVDPECAYWFR